MPQLMPNITDILVHIDNKIYIDSGLLSTDKVDNFEKVFLEWMTTWHTTDNIKFTHIDWSTDKALSDLKWMTGGFLIRNGYVFWSQPEDGESDPATCVFPRDQTRINLLLRRLFQTYIVSGLPQFQTSLGQQGCLKDMFDNSACEVIRDLELVEDTSSSCNNDFECIGGNYESTAGAIINERPISSIKNDNGEDIDTFDIMQSNPGSEPTLRATNDSLFRNANRGKRAFPSEQTGLCGKRRRVNPSDQQPVQRRSSGRLRHPTRFTNRASTEALHEADPNIDGPNKAGRRFASIHQKPLLVIKSKKLRDEPRLLVHSEQEGISNSMSVRTVTIPEGVATAKSTASNSDAAEKGQGYCPAYIKPSTQKISVTGKDIVNPFELDSTESPIKFYVFDEKGLKHRWVHKNPKLILETIETMFDEISGYDRVNIDNLEDLEFKLITSRESIITFESIVYPLKRDTSQDIFGDMKVDVNEYIKKSRIEEPRCRCDINITPIYSSHNKAQDHRCI